MSQLRSLTFKHHSLPPTHSFIPPNFIVPLKRNNNVTFTHTLPSLSVKSYHPELVQPKPFPSPPQRSQVRELPQKVFVGYTVYTRKGVLTVSPRPPEFEAKHSGAYKVSKEGYVLLQFAPAVCIDDKTQYDWNRKQVFSLSVSEMGTLLCLGGRESFEFCHDTFKPKSDEVEVRKILKLEPLLDVTGHLFNLSVQTKHENMEDTHESIFIPVTRAELAVFRSIFDFIMPYLLGWGAFANSIKPEAFSRVNTNPR